MREKEEIEEWRPVRGHEGRFNIYSNINLLNLIKIKMSWHTQVIKDHYQFQ